MWYRCCVFLLFYHTLVVSVSGLGDCIMPYVCVTGYTGIDGGYDRFTFVPSRGNIGDVTVHSWVVVREIMISLEDVEPRREVKIGINGTVASHGLKQFVIKNVELRSNVAGGEISNKANKRGVLF